MNQDFPQQDALRYFFGELSEAELTAFEDKFFTDAEFSDRLEEFETDLIDDYVRGELSATEKMKFEEKYLTSPRRKERVTAATALWEREKTEVTAAAIETPKESIWQRLSRLFVVPQVAFIVPVILFLFLIGGFFLFLLQPFRDLAGKAPTPTPFATASPEPSLNDSVTPTVSPTADKTPVKTPTIKPTLSPTAEPRQIEPPQPVLATATLFPSLRSDGEAKKVVLKKENKNLYLRLNRDTDMDFAKYSVEVRDSGGSLVSTQNLPARKSLGISLPTKNLSNGSYKITLKGAKAEGEFKTVGFYNFLVEKK